MRLSISNFRIVGREHLEEANKRLETECMHVKTKFKIIQRKLSEKQLRASTPINNSENYVKNLRKSLNICKREHKSLKNLVENRKELGREIILQSEIRGLKKRLATALKENTRLNKLKFTEGSLQNYETDLRETEADVENLRGLVQKLEIKNLHLIQTSLKNSEKLVELQSLHASLSEKIAHVPVNVNEKPKNLDLLKNKLKVIEASFNSNTKKFKYKINELEKQLEASNTEYIKIKTQLFKRNQQKRLIEISGTDSFQEPSRSRTPVNYKVFHPDVSFLYKPTVKHLYN